MQIRRNYKTEILRHTLLSANMIKRNKSFFIESKLESTQTLPYIKLWEYFIFVPGYLTLRCSNWGWGPPPPSMSKRTLLKRATAYCCSYTRPNPPIISVVRSGTHKQTCSWDGTALRKKISTLFSLAFFPVYKLIVHRVEYLLSFCCKQKQRNSLQSVDFFPSRQLLKKAIVLCC